MKDESCAHRKTRLVCVPGRRGETARVCSGCVDLFCLLSMSASLSSLSSQLLALSSHHVTWHSIMSPGTARGGVPLLCQPTVVTIHLLYVTNAPSCTSFSFTSLSLSLSLPTTRRPEQKTEDERRRVSGVFIPSVRRRHRRSALVAEYLNLPIVSLGGRGASSKIKTSIQR